MYDEEVQKSLHILLPKMNLQEIESFVIIPAIENILTSPSSTAKRPKYKNILSLLSMRLCKKELRTRVEGKTQIGWKCVYTNEVFIYKSFANSPEFVLVDTDLKKLFDTSLNEIKADFVWNEFLDTNIHTLSQTKFLMGEEVKLSELGKQRMNRFPNGKITGTVCGVCPMNDDTMFIKITLESKYGNSFIISVPESFLEKVK